MRDCCDDLKTGRQKKRIDLYVDESGQDTRGKLFVVAVVAVENSDKLRLQCDTIEGTSGKGKVKWSSAQRDRRLSYLRSIIEEGSSFGITLFYSVFRRTTEYDRATVDGIAKSIRRLLSPGTQIYVFVDGLSKSKCYSYKNGLRKQSCPVKKVSGIRKDENEPLIRLADALAGAAAELLKYKADDLSDMFSQANQSGIIVKV